MTLTVDSTSTELAEFIMADLVAGTRALTEAQAFTDPPVLAAGQVVSETWPALADAILAAGWVQRKHQREWKHL